MMSDPLRRMLHDARLIGAHDDKALEESAGKAGRVIEDALTSVNSPSGESHGRLTIGRRPATEAADLAPGQLPPEDSVHLVDDLLKEMSARLTTAFQDVEKLISVPGALVKAEAGNEEVDLAAWRRIVLISSACVYALRQSVDEGPQPGRGLAARAKALLPAAEWTLFVALSAPLRHGSGNATPAWRKQAKEWVGREPLRGKSAEYSAVVEVFSRGDGDDQVYLARLRKVRAELIETFENWQDHPILRNTPPHNLERAAALLAFDGPTREFFVPDSFTVPGMSRECDVGPSVEGRMNPDPDALPDLVETFFLPRFALFTAFRAIAARSRRWAAWSAALIALSALTGALAVWDYLRSGSSATTPPNWLGVEPWTALAALALVLALLPAALARERVVRLASLLRIPASVAIGAVLLATLAGHWWSVGEDTDWSRYGYATLGFAVLALGYLYFETIGHRVGRWRALWRASVVLVLVQFVALLVVLLAFGLFFPVFVEVVDVPFLATLDAIDDPWHRLLLLLTASTLATVIGLFSQILWDEKTITAPLAHTSWRRRA